LLFRKSEIQLLLNNLKNNKLDWVAAISDTEC